LNDFTIFYTAFINHKNLTEKSFDDMTNTQVRIESKAQFGPLAVVDGTRLETSALKILASEYINA
jgi:hypothetical protein